MRTSMLLSALIVVLGSMGPGTPSATAEDDGPGRPSVIVVKAGPHARKDTPIRFEIPEDRLSARNARALDAGPIALGVYPLRTYARGGTLPDLDAGSVAQADRVKPGLIRVTWVLPEELPAGAERAYWLGGLEKDRPIAWSIAESTPGALELKLGDRPVFRYNAAPVSSPKYKEIQARDAYIHPAYSPSGALITGDFSPSHPHHRGFFLAYERTEVGSLTPDFWNIHVGTGKIHADGLDRPVAGPVTARFSARHRWEAKDKTTGQGTVVLRERWDVEAYAIPGSPYWLFDLTSTQQAVERPLEVLPYRYGGMAYRGPEPFVKGKLDVLTSEDRHRVDGDQKPARWVDLTGPIAEGSDRYAGAMIADHPSNANFPNVARIHPTSLPFFCFVPAYNRALTIGVEAPSVFRYRVLVHDGHPDRALDGRIALDFAQPPAVVVD